MSTVDDAAANVYGPVRDWATDFDHADPAWAADPHAIWADLRRRCPVAHTERYGGVWLPTRYDDIRAAAYDDEHFSSRLAIVVADPVDRDGDWGPAPPLTSAGAHHKDARLLLTPRFTRTAAARLEPWVRALCDDLLDRIEGQAELDVSAGYTQHVSAVTVTHLLGLPVEDADLFRRHLLWMIEGIQRPAEERQATTMQLQDYLDRKIDEHEAAPRADLISELLAFDGGRLAREQVRGILNLLVLAGIDTTWSVIGASLWHLARHPEDAGRLRAEPELLPLAVEELLRAFAPVTAGRRVVAPARVGGVDVEPGSWLLLPYPAANRDPERFEAPDEIRLDRADNRHAAFGLGVHRCLGADLARMEIRVALERWLARVAAFELAGPPVRWSTGQSRGPRELPMRLTWRA